MSEQDKIIERYARRGADPRKAQEWFGQTDVTHLLRIQERHRTALKLLSGHGISSFQGMSILDVGCGDGNFLGQMMAWGACAEHLHGIDLREGIVGLARERYTTLDLRVGSGSALPWESESMDLVVINTVFSSILSEETRFTVANEVRRVLRSSGVILVYDMRWENPKNPDVKAVPLRNLKGLFPDFEASSQSLSLAPPLARRLPSIGLERTYSLLSNIPALRSHICVLLQNNASPG
jgi:SAM-dependent methyltransferase